MTLKEQIESFLAGRPHAVVGASPDRAKYGNKVLRAYTQNQREVYPVHPRAAEVEGLTAYADLSRLPEPVHGMSVITPPSVTEAIVEQAIEQRIEHIWMQPGAESPVAVERARRAGLNVIAGNACILVALGFRDV